MKATLWTVIILFVLIVACGIASATISERISSDFTKDLEIARESVRSSNWDQAKTEVRKMADEWESVCEWLQFWVNHGDTDDVNMALERLDAAIEAQDASYSLVTMAELGESLRHIHHRDALRLGNIL